MHSREEFRKGCREFFFAKDYKASSKYWKFPIYEAASILTLKLDWEMFNINRKNLMAMFWIQEIYRIQ